MVHVLAVLVVFALGFGAGRIKNSARFEAKVAAEVAAAKAKL